MLVLSEQDVLRILTPDMAIRSAERAFAAFSDGSAVVPPRIEIHRIEPEGTSLVMAGLIDNATLGVKLVGSVVSPGDPPRRNTTCLILVWDAATLEPRALISADAMNDHRTAAGFAVGTRLLARANSATHALFGTGKLAMPTACYVARVRPIRRLIIIGRTRSNVLALAERLRAEPAIRGAEIVTDMTADEAVAEADVVTTVTRSADPLFDGGRIRPGTHINLGGAMRRHEREMDDGAARKARFYLDSEATCLERAGDIAIPLERGIISKSQILGEIGNVILGRVQGRLGDQDVTVFRSMGIAAQDLCLAEAVVEEAENRKEGQSVFL